ncbi:hypothetical protein E3N88_17109 [Mikania micrantha]|uniref:Uncharacterized protein n=1 Tax=Mikania micrantha TaxID=192012 RepID=A0A5N6NSQ6_9ASTR|nr:hypothetical protein E3N88_17109 [Mikania micrantha]
MKPSTDKMNLDEPPHRKEYPLLEGGVGKHSCPRLAVNLKSKKQEVVTTRSRTKSDVRFGLKVVGNGLIMATNEAIEDGEHCHISAEEEFSISPEIGHHAVAPVDTDMCLDGEASVTDERGRT